MPDNTSPEADNASPETDNASPETDNASPETDNASPETDNANIVPDDNKKKKKRKQRRKNKGNKDTQDQTNVNKDIGDQQNTQAPKDQVSDSGKGGQRKKNKRSRGRRFDRYFGRFRCRICRKTWDSAHVFTLAGTMKVLFKQRCKICTTDDAWMFPYALELLKCSICQSTPCECRCDECNKLIHKRYIQDPEGEKGKPIVDERCEYCDCTGNKRSSKARVGANIDLKKPHLAHLCQKCLKGFPCCGASSDENYDHDSAEPGDNEP